MHDVLRQSSFYGSACLGKGKVKSNKLTVPSSVCNECQTEQGKIYFTFRSQPVPLFEVVTGVFVQPVCRPCLFVPLENLLCSEIGVWVCHCRELATVPVIKLSDAVGRFDFGSGRWK